jgi:hypothetical protein
MHESLALPYDVGGGELLQGGATMPEAEKPVRMLSF